MDLLNHILYDTIYHSTPIILCVLGGMFAYKANVLNIALEGMMLSGAFFTALIVLLTESIALGIVAGISSSLILGLIFSFMGITKKGNVIIVGLAVNLFVPALIAFILQLMSTSNINLNMLDATAFKINIPIIKDIPLLGGMLSGHPPLTYLSFAAIALLSVLMYHTKFGIYVRVVGENEDAAKSLGIKSDLFKYAAVLIGSVCCALAGVNLSLERLALFTNDMTAGRGFIAIAAIYCGQGKPVASSMYAILFGVARALAINLSIYAGAASGLFDIIPYIVMVIVLAVVSALKYRNSKSRIIKLE